MADDRFTLRLPPEDLERLRTLADANSMSVSEYARQAIGLVLGQRRPMATALHVVLPAEPTIKTSIPTALADTLKARAEAEDVHPGVVIRRAIAEALADG